MEQYNLPRKVSEYISNSFPGASLCEVTNHEDAHGHLYYEVELSHNDMMYHLRFNETGNLVRKIADDKFPEGGSVKK